MGIKSIADFSRAEILMVSVYSILKMVRSNSKASGFIMS